MLLLGNSDPQNTDQHVKQADPSRTQHGFILVFRQVVAVVYVSSAVVLLVTASAVTVGRKAAFLSVEVASFSSWSLAICSIALPCAPVLLFALRPPAAA